MHNYFLKHKTYKDVCFKVLAQYMDETGTTLEIHWWNLGQTGTSYPMRLVQNTRIEYTDFPNWVYTEDNVRNLRTANWKELYYETPKA